MVKLFFNKSHSNCNNMKAAYQIKFKRYLSDLPQGDNLSLLLFFIFINEIKMLLKHSKCL